MEYHKDITTISKSGLDQIAKSPLHYWERYLNPNHVETSTAALEFGSPFHTAILEPIEFEHMYAVAPKVDRRTKEGKQAWVEFELENMGKKIISSDEYQIIQGMQASILNHHEASILLSAKTHVEQIFTHQDKKCKPDFLTSHNIICDLKTTEDASPWGFGRSAHKYRYDVQAAFYMDILEANGMKSRLVLQVHDEVIVEAPKDEHDAVNTLVLDIMRHATDLIVPLEVNSAWGTTWAEAK